MRTGHKFNDGCPRKEKELWETGVVQPHDKDAEDCQQRKTLAEARIVPSSLRRHMRLATPSRQTLASRTV